MKKALVLMSHNRPEYMRPTLEGILSNDLAGWKLILSQNITPPVTEIVNHFWDRISGSPEFVGAINDPPYVLHNPPRSIESHYWEIFENVTRGFDLISVVEDDMPPTSDWTRLCEWYGSEQSDHVMLFAGNSSGEFEPLDAVISNPWSRSTGSFCTTRRQWEENIRRWWWNDPRGWDFSVEAASKSEGSRRTLMPRVSRAKFIGLYGHHAFPELVQEHYAKVVTGSAPRGIKYRIESPG